LSAKFDLRDDKRSPDDDEKEDVVRDDEGIVRALSEIGCGGEKWGIVSWCWWAWIGKVQDGGGRRSSGEERAHKLK
jgi:hypothetical protein